MPVVNIEMWEGRNEKAKRRLIEEVTNAVTKALGVSPEHVTVIIHDVPKTNWGAQGKQASNIC